MKTIIEFNKSTLRTLHDAVLGATFDSLDQEQLRELHAQIVAAWYGDCQVRQHCDKEEAAHPDWPTHLGMACQPCALETARQLVRDHEVDDMHRSHVENLIDVLHRDRARRSVPPNPNAENRNVGRHA